MKYLSTRQLAKKWGVSPRRIQKLCVDNRISGVIRIGNYWAVPEDAKKPKDERIKTGKYIKRKNMD